MPKHFSDWVNINSRLTWVSCRLSSLALATLGRSICGGYLAKIREAPSLLNGEEEPMVRSPRLFLIWTLFKPLVQERKVCVPRSVRRVTLTGWGCQVFKDFNYHVVIPSATLIKMMTWRVICFHPPFAYCGLIHECLHFWHSWFLGFSLKMRREAVWKSKEVQSVGNAVRVEFAQLPKWASDILLGDTK